MSHFHTLHWCFGSPKSTSTVQTPGRVGSGWTAVHYSLPSHDVSIFQPIFTDLPTFTYMFTNIKTYMSQINPGYSGYKKKPYKTYIFPMFFHSMLFHSPWRDHPLLCLRGCWGHRWPCRHLLRHCAHGTGAKWQLNLRIFSGKLAKNLGTSQFLMGKLTNYFDWAMFNSELSQITKG